MSCVSITVFFFFFLTKHSWDLQVFPFNCAIFVKNYGQFFTICLLSRPVVIISLLITGKKYSLQLWWAVFLDYQTGHMIQFCGKK